MKGEVSCLVLNFVGYDFGGYFLLPLSHFAPVCSGEQWLVFEATVARESRGSRWKLWLGRGQVASSSTGSLVLLEAWFILTLSEPRAPQGKYDSMHP